MSRTVLESWVLGPSVLLVWVLRFRGLDPGQRTRDPRTKTSRTDVKGTIKLRLPGWTRNEVAPGGLYAYTDRSDRAAVVSINGARVATAPDRQGYVSIDRTWKPGDVIDVEFPVTPRRRAGRWLDLLRPPELRDRWLALRSGRQNTTDILAACTDGGADAHLCASLDVNGVTGWFLPSRDELVAMYRSLKATSTVPFGDQDFPRRVRAIRAF